MQRRILAILTPPIAIYRFGYTSYCIAPVTVFWLASISSLIYAFFGGPAQLSEFSWGTFGLGIALWAIAAMWAENVIKGVDADPDNPGCKGKTSSLYGDVSSRSDETSPLDEVNKYL